MALIGQGQHSIDGLEFNSLSMGWDGAYTIAEYTAYAGQGFEFPVDTLWVNKPTGHAADDGNIMGFPRSAESQPGQAAGAKWYVSEA